MTPIRAAIYARVSSSRQKHNTSIATQLEDCHAAAERLGWVVAGEYCDVAQSGRRDDRPALERLKADVAARKIDAVLVWKLDRLSRRTAAALDLIDRHFKHVLFESATESLDRYTSGGRFSIAIAAAVAQYQSDQLGERIRRAGRFRAEQGRWVGSAPFGYRAVGGTLEPTEDAPTVQLIYELYATGRYGTPSLADELNRRGLTMRDRETGARYPFGTSTVRVILMSPAYAGLAVNNGDLFPGLHPPLVDQDLWEAVQAIRIRQYRGGSRPSVYSTALLSGIAACGCCDGRMWAHSSRGRPKSGQSERPVYWYYRCIGAQRRTCGAPMARMAPVDGAVAALIRRLALPDDVFAEARERLRRPALVATAGPDPVQVRAQMDRLTEMYIAGRLERADYHARYDALAESLRVAPPAEQLDYDAALAALRDLPRMYATATAEEQRELVQILFDTIWLRPDASIAAIRPHQAMAEALHAVVCGVGPGIRTTHQHTSLILPPLWRSFQTPYDFAA